MDSDALVVIGPTASGKTDLAIAVARRLDGEVVSLDSRQVYRGMDIGTAKPASSEQGGVPHHGFDLVDPDERFNAGRFAALAREWIAAIRGRGRVPVLAGGTGFYLRALTHPLFDEPPMDDARRDALARWLADLPLAELRRWAAALEPDRDRLPQDRQRLARIIEVAVLTGRRLSWWHEHAPPRERPVDPMVFVLDLPRDVLYRRIDERVDRMVAAGLVDEVRRLLERGYAPGDPGMNATGYVELVPHVHGECGLEESMDAIRRATRRYARRQLTWLRNQLPDAPRLDAAAPTGELAERVARAWRGGQG